MRIECFAAVGALVIFCSATALAGDYSVTGVTLAPAEPYSVQLPTSVEGSSVVATVYGTIVYDDQTVQFQNPIKMTLAPTSLGYEEFLIKVAYQYCDSKFAIPASGTFISGSHDVEINLGVRQPKGIFSVRPLVALTDENGHVSSVYSDTQVNCN